MKACVGIAIAAALLAFAQGCSDGDDEQKLPPGICSPTVQTDPDPEGARAFCTDVLEAWCGRSFGDCPQLGADFPSLEECRSASASICSSSFSNDWYDPGCGAVCIAFLRGAECDVLVATDELQACDAATGSFGPEPPSTPGNPAGTCTPTVQTDPDPTGAQEFCTDLYAAMCSRSFGDCPQLGAPSASLDQCLSDAAATCAMLAYSNDWYDAACGAVCIAFVGAADCSVLLATAEPQACGAATGSFAPEPPSTTVTPGNPPATCTPTVQTDPDPAGAQEFCTDFYAALCSRSFGDCPELGAPVDTLEQCLAETAAACAMLDHSNDWYDAGCGGACIAFVGGADCSVLVATPVPQACGAATGSFTQ